MFVHAIIAGLTAAALIATSAARPEPLFRWQVFASSTCLYFVPIDPDADSFDVWYTDGSQSPRRFNVPLPDDIEFTSASPFCAGNGGGSGECIFLLELQCGDETVYVSYDNFDYTDASDCLDFKYRGIADADTVENVRTAFETRTPGG
ncbi:MAG: hypothetical protein IJ493_06430 [Clostridia bacterium]|nr:hypothetical protein [Clostridia bacterium]